MVELLLNDIQGLLLHSYTTEPYSLLNARFMFVNVKDRESGLHWLTALFPFITTATPPTEKPKTCVNVAFTFSGLRCLGLSSEILQSFPIEFQEGMKQRSSILGDNFQSDPSNWETYFKDEENLHIVLLIYAMDLQALDEETTKQEHLLEASGQIQILARQDAGRLPEGIEHFGFKDGSSQPVIEGNDTVAHPGQDIIKPGEFILGYPNQDGDIVNPLSIPEIGLNGTFVVYRKLYQDVALFRKFTTDVASRSNPPLNNSELIAAKMVGRWRSGAPLVLKPDHDDPLLGKDPDQNNDFNYYQEDREGLKCPIGSHIRRVNPRDTLFRNNPELSKSEVNKRRIIRRGISYGPIMPAASQNDDAVDRGLIFITIQSSIAQQFEFIQQKWINNPIFLGLSKDKDPIAGNSNKNANMTIQRTPISKKLWDIPRFTITRGGCYLFLPGLKALQKLAEIGASSPP
ncbi:MULTISPECIES: Dyp-type peroxidase [Nostoc]|uniref:Dyp-type peroxidase n=2 Tax=Nostoc TaxID=1177 RepID=A0ABR8IKQ6_9NOSO|nr:MULTISPECIES: Dyp-type peroxidase [Nostoc]MBD2564847.1 Dyp-type peroxidase [Nostoc linckia FACHB-391]MBD2651386.1 Dyp-type peroxidase [Nostoc foliaceum FACHB-393]